MTTYVSELDVSLNAAEERDLKKRGFNIIDGNLNEGAGGYDIRLWSKRGPLAITKVQVSFNDEMAVGLTKAGYTKIEKDLNAGAAGSYLYIWFLKGSGEFDTPIVDISVSTDATNEAEKFASGWQRVACDLNRKAEGNWIHVWLKREEQTYICDVDATDSYGSDIGLFQKGYIRVDEDTNRGAGGAYVFIWYRQTTDPEKALRKYKSPSMLISIMNIRSKITSQWLLTWTKGPEAIALLLNEVASEDYPEAGIKLIEGNLNMGNKGSVEHLCFYQ
ncbi:Glycine dehydrogenase (decarboxylating) [Dissostichus eleginoides]|uniref:Glycine dehydrogenase (Decarboxylating) n=1 Tax=Dissostichus eleginoides TaxID=100907 RepID=A0AAD9EYG3_DISEL|nr:Glycine dehydrogenase (decarboxylating) [Dissostichus eleginoides]